MFDFLTASALADDLSHRIDGGRVQVTGLVSRDTMAIEFYAQHRRQTLIVSLGGREPAAWLANGDVRPDPSLQTPFTLLMRKYLRGALLTAVSQPPLDRIIQLSFAKLIDGNDNSSTPEDDEEEVVHDGTLRNSMLSIEIMGRRSNVVLVGDDGLVLDALKRVNPQMSAVRPILPRRQYTLPPSGDRLDPRQITGADLIAFRTWEASALGQPGKSSGQKRPDMSLAGLLVRAVAAVSPQMAREIVFRALGDAEALAADCSDVDVTNVAGAIRHVFATVAANAWQPTVVTDSDGEVVAYSALPLTHVEGEGVTQAAVDSISAAIEAWRGASPVSARHGARRERLLRKIEPARARALAKVRTLEEEQRALADGDRYRRWGEAIFANLWAIQSGQEVLEWEGEQIPLPAGTPASEIAQEYFSLYRKAGRGQDQLESLIARARSELDYVEQMVVMASMAETFDEIEAVRAEWEAFAPEREQRGGKPGKGPRGRRLAAPKPHHDDAGNAIYVGRSGELNDLVTFSIASSSDFWLHARGVPGAHVIVRPVVQGADVPDETLERAASLAAYFSASRDDSRVEVDICRRRDVRKISGAGPGMVTYRNERTVRVAPVGPEGLFRSR
jgi:predicted ribosome quality control (RQC) complex YloA/Tae2 family protein